MTPLPTKLNKILSLKRSRRCQCQILIPVTCPVSNFVWNRPPPTPRRSHFHSPLSRVRPHRPHKAWILSTLIIIIVMVETMALSSSDSSSSSRDCNFNQPIQFLEHKSANFRLKIHSSQRLRRHYRILIKLIPTSPRLVKDQNLWLICTSLN